jgi:hypothetical protein
VKEEGEVTSQSRARENALVCIVTMVYATVLLLGGLMIAASYGILLSLIWLYNRFPYSRSAGINARDGAVAQVQSRLEGASLL